MRKLRRWLRQLHEELKFTSVFVTHDQEEATEVADRVVVMSQGHIEQADAPDQVWREPATRFVLEFMGEVNRLQGTVRGGQFHVGAHRWPLGYTPAYQGPVDLFLRPWEVDVSRRTSLDSPLPVQVLEASPKGHYTQLVVQPLGWYNEPLTVVMQGDNPQAAVNVCLWDCKMRVCITVNSGLKRVKPNLLWHNPPDRLIRIVIARWRYAYRAYGLNHDL